MVNVEDFDKEGYKKPEKDYSNLKISKIIETVLDNLSFEVCQTGRDDFEVTPYLYEKVYGKRLESDKDLVYRLIKEILDEG